MLYPQAKPGYRRRGGLFAGAAPGQDRWKSCSGNGAGDQGIMVGYACNETPQMLPLPVVLARRLTNRLTMVRKSGVVAGLRPDGKAQVTVEYDEDGKTLRLDTIVLSAPVSYTHLDVYKRQS